MSRKTGCSGGYGGSQHLIAKNFYSNGIQGGMTPIAAGVSSVLKKTGNNISIVFIGDGTLGQGILYEALNISGIYNLPILFILEDNGIAQSTLTSTFKLEELKKRIEGFSINYFESTSDDWDNLNKNLMESVQSARTTGPTFIRIKTRRLFSHSKGDDNRDDLIINENYANDPLEILLQESTELSEFKSEFNDYLRTISNQVHEEEPLQTVKRFVPIQKNQYFLTSNLLDEELNLKEQIYNYLKSILEDGGTFIGEDIRNKSENAEKEYGGAFKVSMNLSDKFPNDVLNFPISEQSIIGFSTGIALAGSKSISEIMFGDFTTLIVDQVVQHISKFSTMYGENVPMRMLIRTPMGGRRGYGPTHSQSLERFFLFHQGLIAVSANHRTNLQNVLSSFMSDGNPVILFEHKTNYLLKKNHHLANGYNVFLTDDNSNDVVIKSDKKPEYTIFCYGYSLKIAEEILDELSMYNLNFEVICPTVVSPINILPLLKSCIKTKKIILIEEGSGAMGLSSACLAELSNSRVKLEYSKIYSNETIIPASMNAELELLDFKKHIISDILSNEGIK